MNYPRVHVRAAFAGVMALLAVVVVVTSSSARSHSQSRRAEAAPSIVRVQPASAPTATRTTADDAFIAELRNTYHGRIGKTVPLIGYGHEICSDKDAGWSAGQIGTLGFSNHNLTAVTVAAIAHFCPQYRQT